METFLSQSFIYSIVYILKHGCLVADKNEVTKDLEWADSILSAFRWCERQEPPWSFMIHLVKFPATCMVVFGVIPANRQFAEKHRWFKIIKVLLSYCDLDRKLKFASTILITRITTILVSLVHFPSYGPKMNRVHVYTYGKEVLTVRSSAHPIHKHPSPAWFVQLFLR